VEFFLNAEEGAGVAVDLGDTLPLTLSAGVNLGDDRKDDDADVLNGTPDITNSYVVFGGAEIDLDAIGLLSAQVTYAPITMDYQDAERKDTDYTGLLASLDWEYKLGFNRVMVNAELGATWMNTDYAEANYSLLYPTNRLKTFKAQSGLQDVHASTTVIYMLSERFAIALVGEGTYLLGDAADSPFTQSTFQPFGGAFIVYRF
jgi:outer membrane scaffolding protein for murein synthesis (MipA/OmpV family)